MQNGMLLLPFLSIFTFILAIATGKAYKEAPFLGLALFCLSALFCIIWVVKDKRSFRDLFRRKGARHGISQGVSVILSVLLALGVGYLTKKERFNKTFDVTREGSNTLSVESLKLIDQLKNRSERLKVSAFFQSEEKKNEFRKALSLYQSKGVSFDVEYIDPQTEPTRAMSENITSADTVVLKGGKQESRLTSFTEEKITNAIVRILKNKERIIYFVNGHGEADLNSQDAQGYASAKTELESERFIVKQLNILEMGRIPEDTDLLVIAGPKYDIHREEVSVIKNYLALGKPLLVLVDALVQVPQLNGLLAETGVRFNDDLLVIRPDDPRAKLLGQNNAIVTDFDKFSPVTAEYVKRGGIALVTANTRSLEILGENSLNLKVTGLAKSSEIIVKIKNIKTEADLKGRLGPDRIENGKFDVFAVANGTVAEEKIASSETKGGQAGSDVQVNLKGESPKELRVFVGGSSQLASNLGAQRTENMDLFINAINYLVQDEDFISVRAKDSTKSQLSLTSATSQFLLLALTWIYPFLFLGFGSFYWLRRRRA